MKRRAFLSGIASAAAAAGRRPSTSGLPPRKVIVGTVVQPFWVKHPGLEKRLAELGAIVDRMSAESRKKYGRGPDLAVLPEVAITGESGGSNHDSSVPLEGPVNRAFSEKAREHRCYIIAPAYLREASGQGCSNANVLFGRKGEVVGTYRKVHLVVMPDGKTLEGRATPGRDFPVFDCDFGKLGMQICYDMEFDQGWQALSSRGADLIAWPTQSPQTAQPAFRAMQQRCYIVSSTWRHNASIFEPTGKITAQVTESGAVLVEQIDLSYALLPWSSRLRRGKAMEEKYGKGVGYRYYEEEDWGIFWSNDPNTPIREMVRKLGLTEAEDQLEQVRKYYGRLGVHGF